MLDKKVRIVAGPGMSAELRKAIREAGNVYGIVVGVFWGSNTYRVRLDDHIVIPGFSEPIIGTTQHRILVPMTNVREIE